MSFMDAEITSKQAWVMVDGDGVDYVPGELVNLVALQSALDAEDIDAAFALVRDYPVIGHD